MPTVRCWQLDCLYNADGSCRAEEIEYDPAEGCLTMTPRPGVGDADDEEDSWERGGLRLLDE
jgi:hypothetical protein